MCFHDEKLNKKKKNNWMKATRDLHAECGFALLILLTILELINE